MKASESKKTLQEHQPPSLNSTLCQPTLRPVDDDDDFQDPFQSLPLTQTTFSRKHSNSSPSKSSWRNSSLQPLKPSNSAVSRPSKKPERLSSYATGKENLDPSLVSNMQETQTSYAPCDLGLDLDCVLESIESTSSHELQLDAPSQSPDTVCSDSASLLTEKTDTSVEKVGLQPKAGCTHASNSIESRLLRSNLNCPPIVCENGGNSDGDNFEPGTQLDVLLKLWSEQFNHSSSNDLGCASVQYPICGVDISYLSDE